MFNPKGEHVYNSDSNSTYTTENFNNLHNQNLSMTTTKTAHNNKKNVRVNVGDIQFGVQNTENESDVCSPPLWKSCTPNNYGNMSPNSRSRAVSKGQRELMEMARNMPESFYELSLKDIVDHPMVETPKGDDEERCLVDDKNFKRNKSLKQTVEKQKSKKVEKRMERVKSAKMEHGGMFLKLGFPISLRSKRKKNLIVSPSQRVSPKVETLGKSSSEKDWWKKQFSGSSGNESTQSGVTSMSSGSTKSTMTSNSSRSCRKSKRSLAGCLSFALSRKHKRKTT